MNRLIAWALSLLLAALAGCRSASHATTTAPIASLPASPWYEPEIRAFEAADAASLPPPGAALFIGSSTIRIWATLADDMSPVPIISRGFGGSKTADVLAVFDRIVLPYHASIIVYYCGDNDLGTDNTDSASAAAGFIAFDQRARAHWPDIRVFYISIKPSLARWSNWLAMSRANDLVRAYCAHTPGATFLDTASTTLTVTTTPTLTISPDPTLLRDDGLHLNELGYAAWTTVIRPPVLEAWEKCRK